MPSGPPQHWVLHDFVVLAVAVGIQRRILSHFATTRPRLGVHFLPVENGSRRPATDVEKLLDKAATAWPGKAPDARTSHSMEEARVAKLAAATGEW